MVFRNFDLFPLYDTPEKADQDEKSQLAHEVLLPKPIDKGFYYKFNCSNEIKLIKYFLEDNGFVPQPYKIKQMSTTFQMAHGGNKEVKKEGDDWLVLWSTKPLKIGMYANFKKFQKVNQFPKSFELTRKDLLVESVQKM